MHKIYNIPNNKLFQDNYENREDKVAKLIFGGGVLW